LSRSLANRRRQAWWNPIGALLGRVVRARASASMLSLMSIPQTTCLLLSWALAGTRIGNAPLEDLLGQRRSPLDSRMTDPREPDRWRSCSPSSRSPVGWVLARVDPDALDVPSAPG
jgi:hypothetical protein